MSEAHTPILLLADCSHHTRLNHLEQVADLGTESLVEVLKKKDILKGKRGDLSCDEGDDILRATGHKNQYFKYINRCRERS